MKLLKSLTSGFIHNFAKGGIKIEHSPGTGKIIERTKEASTVLIPTVAFDNPDENK